MPGTLYVVSTPIGNLEDMTHRAVRVLGDVDVVACEDTRHTRKLLNHYGIKTKTISYHEHNEQERAVELIESIKAGMNVAIVSDAGTPSISDPGFRVVRMALEEGISVVPLPGATAFVSALVASGLPGSEIFFRDPTAWERYRVQILLVCAVVLVQSALIAWLIYARRKRRRSETAA